MTLPIIEQLQGMKTDSDRADWLAKCPFSILVRHHAEVWHALEAVHFSAGLRSLEADMALLASVRTEDGQFRQEPLFAAHVLRSDMRLAAKRG